MAIAHPAAPDAKWASEGASKWVAQDSIAGIAVWATVSEAVDLKITEQVKAGVFPRRLVTR